MSELNRSMVDQMNHLPGTPYPAEVGGVVDAPRGVLFTGDTTDNGTLEEFAEFEAVYGLSGRDGLLRYPVYEAIGNHDLNRESPIKARAIARHGGINYSLDWEDLRVVCLDMYPDAATLEWLRRDLARVDRDRPLIPFFHYSIEGHYSYSWEPEEKAAFGDALRGRNVVAIFHGHEHRMGRYVWRGHEVFRPGAPRHSSHHFLVVRVGPREMSVAAWDFDRRAWAQSWTVPVRRGAGVQSSSVPPNGDRPASEVRKP
jgi:cytolysin (calcineurin-like family phosphatase)